MSGSCPVSAHVCQETARERDDLRRWKDEALPVLTGLQELGKALGIPPGSRITGQDALAAVERLTRERDELRAEVKRLTRECDDERRAFGIALDRKHRLLHERDAARAEVERLRAEIKALADEWYRDARERQDRRLASLEILEGQLRRALDGPTLHRLEDVAEEFGVDLTEGEDQ